MLSIKRPASTHATLHLASMSGVLEEEAEAQKSSGGSRGLKNNGTGKRVERGVWTMMVKEHRLGAGEQVQSLGVLPPPLLYFLFHCLSFKSIISTQVFFGVFLWNPSHSLKSPVLSA